MDWAEHIAKQEPKELKSNCRTFLLPTEDMCVHIVETGFSQRQKYLVVFEDAYQQLIGQTLMLSKTEIKEKFNIEL